ncbi:E3 ubiquitin-protein ligase TRIM47-like isoform X2 [Echeneis naucrates]|uniref:E3 ubiquitin-protein ligase TRIM47-like isoform X2 n=1 Tax=Echeneis naucrates TaxID=173247 RepID=UPI0011143432|nr:E3 ubiquitin-protein ligase TRIM47-like isoform X2 [Echeneis naucrates]
MAAATISVDQEQFCCSVCLETLRDPVTIPCGHSYCLDCIEDYWNRTKQKGQYSCPQCRQVFNPKPLLSRNTVLGELLEKFQKSRFQASAQQPETPDEVKCSVCTLRKSKAAKSCLVCSESYCVPHLKVHEERFHGKAHQLIPASDHLKEKLCPEHDKVLRLYCRTEQQCVCSQCVKDRHKGHEAVPVAEERATQQKKLQETSLKSVQKWKDTEKELRYIIKYIKHSADAVVEESERIFSRLIRSIEKQSCEVKELIRVQERAAVSQAEEQLEKIQREAAAARRMDAELEKFCRTQDHIHFLQNCRSIYFHVKTPEMPSTDAPQYLMYKTMRASLADLKSSLDETLEREFNRISEKVLIMKEACNKSSSEKSKAKDADVPYNSELKTRADFLQFGGGLPHVWSHNPSQTTRTASPAGPRCCVELGWPGGATGRWSGLETEGSPSVSATST